jgi:hypothetical protein
MARIHRSLLELRNFNAERRQDRSSSGSISSATRAICNSSMDKIDIAAVNLNDTWNGPIRCAATEGISAISE